MSIGPVVAHPCTECPGPANRLARKTRTKTEYPGFIISALRGGSGKTLISLGIAAAMRKRGLSVIPFKKGPDYIDAGWLALSAGRPCHNLDTFLLDRETVQNSYHAHFNDTDGIAVIEGNRGLYDGIDDAGTTSTAELAKLLGVPVILCVDCTKSTRTMAAVIFGCIRFDPEVDLKGVILNRVAGSRHEAVLRDNIERYCKVPVIGALPTLRCDYFPERHMGLVPTPEHDWAKNSIEAVAETATRHIDIDALLKLVSGNKNNFAGPRVVPFEAHAQDLAHKKPDSFHQAKMPKIGVCKDSAFQFYYPENIEALMSAGAEIVWVSPLSDSSLPKVDGLYIGGGFPETHAEKLSGNAHFRAEVKSVIEDGMPVYAECGGLMYLGESLVLDGSAYPMVSVLPIIFGFSEKPKGHGYTVLTVENPNPYFAKGAEIRGHEFHYSSVLEWRGNDEDMAFSMKRGAGFHNKRDGVCHKNVLATYTHIHALGVPSWAPALVANAKAYMEQKMMG